MFLTERVVGSSPTGGATEAAVVLIIAAAFFKTKDRLLHNMGH